MAHSDCEWNAGVRVKLCYPLTMCATPERLRDASCGGDIQIDYLYPLTWIITRPTTPIGCCVFACCQRPGLISNIA